MASYDPHSWFTLIFNSYSKTIYKQLGPAMIMLAIYTTGLVLAMEHYFSFDYKGATTIHNILGIVLGLFLVFRTNTAYDRWWEGRKQWGALVNCCRNLGLKIDALLGDNHQKDRVAFARLISNFVFAMKEHLREGVIMDEIQELEEGGLKEAMLKKGHKPMFMVDRIYKRLNRLMKEGELTGEQLIVIDQDAQKLMNIIGACERIKNTPIPRSYNMFIKKFIFIYSVTLPFGLITLTQYWTIPIVMIIFYLLVSTELIAEEIEDPFGRDDNDLPTDNLSVKIRGNVEEALGVEK